jgi:hypothetical protein
MKQKPCSPDKRTASQRSVELVPVVRGMNCDIRRSPKHILKTLQQNNGDVGFSSLSA